MGDASSNPKQGSDQTYLGPRETRTRSGSTKSNSHSHKRSISGNIFARLPFLRQQQSQSHSQSTEQPPCPPRLSQEENVDHDGMSPFPQLPLSPAPPFATVEVDSNEPEDSHITAPPRNAAISSVLASSASQSQQARKRKGSLRKTALLGTGKLRPDRRSTNPEPHVKKSPQRHLERRPTQRSPTRFTFELPNSSAERTNESIDKKAEELEKIRAELAEEKRKLQHQQQQQHIPDNSESSKMRSNVESKRPYHAATESSTSLTSPAGPYSTTDEDDGIALPQGTKALSSGLLPPSFKSVSASPSPPSSESSGSAAIPHVLHRHFSGKKAPPSQSPLSTAPDFTAVAAAAAAASANANAEEAEWNYSETEWWGWVILIVTWIVFVVGMGSCFEVWSWAWDVGETPYAPPELEDDPTLPIVGYYPALIILTAVMSWVWVVVAWVGLKYFKHAKIQSDDT